MEKTMMDFLVDSMVYALDYRNLKVMLNLNNDNEVLDFLDDFHNWNDLIGRVGDDVYNFVCDNITINETYIDKSFFEEALGEVDWEKIASNLVEKWLGDNESDYESRNW